MIRFNKYPGGKPKAATMSFDDGNVADYRLVEIFNRFGIKGTFHLNSGLLHQGNRVDVKDIPSLYTGHEIAAHGVEHASLYHLTPHGMVEEILEDRRSLEEIAGYVIRGMSYANGVNPPEAALAAKMSGIEYSRTTVSTKSFRIPEDFLLWHPTCKHLEAEEMTKRFLKQTYESGHLLYIWGHSFEFNNDNNWDLIERVCDMLTSVDNIWYATNIEIYDYITASRRVHVSANGKILENPTTTDVWFSNNGETLCIKSGETLYL